MDCWVYLKGGHKQGPAVPQSGRDAMAPSILALARKLLNRLESTKKDL